MGSMAENEASMPRRGGHSASIKGAIVGWLGILGGAITLFSNVSALLDVANWARWLVHQWRAWTRASWQLLLGWLHIEVTPLLASALSLILFVGLLAVSVRLRSDERPNLKTALGSDPKMTLRKILTRLIVYALGVGGLFAVIYQYGDTLGPAFDWIADFQNKAERAFEKIPMPLHAAWGVLIASACVAITVGWISLSALRYGLDLNQWPESTDRTLAIALISLIALCFLLPVSGDIRGIMNVYNAGMFLAIGALAIAPSRPLNQKLLFVVIGVGLLIGLSELSKLGIDLKAPQVSG